MALPPLIILTCDLLFLSFFLFFCCFFLGGGFRPLGPRLSAAAMNIVYGNTSEPYRGPEAATATVALVDTNSAASSSPTCENRTKAATAATGVTVAFKDGTVGSGGLKWVSNECPYIVLEKEAGMKTESPDCKSDIANCIQKCGWWDIEMGAGNWHMNVTATISGNNVIVSTPVGVDGCPLYPDGSHSQAPTAVRYLK